MAKQDLAPFERFRGLHGLVMGLGLFGGGVESAKFLAGYCDHVLVTDLRDESVLAESVAALAGLKTNIEFRLGEHREEDFRRAGVVIHSPAVRPDNSYLEVARSAGAEVTMEMSLFIEACPAKTIGITGSNGKTTTALLCYEMLCEVLQRAQPELEDRWAKPGEPIDAADQVWIGGNCGKPLLNRIGSMSPRDVVVLELSSFQLQDWHRLRRSCHTSLITNITPNHLDWHRDFEEYVWAKSAAYRYARTDERDSGTLMLNLDQTGLAAMLPSGSECRAGYSVRSELNKEMAASGADERLQLPAIQCDGINEPPRVWARRADLALPGEFNWSNAVAAAAITASTCPRAAAHVARSLRRFRGVEHRLEFCGEVNGARCFNDSIATTPEATMAALGAFDTARIHLILGGSEKGLEYTLLAERIAGQGHVKAIYLQGANADAIAEALSRFDLRIGSGSGIRVERHPGFESACKAALKAVSREDVLLMSPSSASFYEYAPGIKFTNFEERGHLFKTLVKAHATTTD